MSTEQNQVNQVLDENGNTGQEPLASSSEELQRLLKEEQKKATEYLEGWQRTKADFVNLKRRTENERAVLSAEARERTLVRLLPIIDDFERALQNIPEALKNEPWLNGISLIDKKMKNLLEQEGVSEIPAKDAEFDPRFHEAVSHNEESQGEKDFVSEVYQKGYRMGDRVIRPAMVVVERR